MRRRRAGRYDYEFRVSGLLSSPFPGGSRVNMHLILRRYVGLRAEKNFGIRKVGSFTAGGRYSAAGVAFSTWES